MQAWITNRFSLTNRIRLLSVLSLILAFAQTLFDFVIILSYRYTMADFQASWLYFNCGALVVLVIVLLYGFHAMAKRTYHSATNFRSWTLFVGSCLGFSGFFHIIGQCKDNQLFYGNCSYNFVGKHNETRLPDGIAVHSYAYCFRLFHTLLICFIAIWLCHTVALMFLFLQVNKFKNENFCEEEEEAKEEHRQECEKRKMQTKKEIDAMHAKATLYPSIYVQPPSPDSASTPSSGSTGSEMSW